MQYARHNSSPQSNPKWKPSSPGQRRHCNPSLLTGQRRGSAAFFPGPPSFCPVYPPSSFPAQECHPHVGGGGHPDPHRRRIAPPKAGLCLLTRAIALGESGTNMVVKIPPCWCRFARKIGFPEISYKSRTKNPDPHHPGPLATPGLPSLPRRCTIPRSLGRTLLQHPGWNAVLHRTGELWGLT